MIARHWHGRVPGRHAERLAEHLRATGITAAATVPGYAGTRVRRSEDGTSADFELITYWYSCRSAGVPLRGRQHFGLKVSVTSLPSAGDGRRGDCMVHRSHGRG